MPISQELQNKHNQALEKLESIAKKFNESKEFEWLQTLFTKKKKKQLEEWTDFKDIMKKKEKEHEENPNATTTSDYDSSSDEENEGGKELTEEQKKNRVFYKNLEVVNELMGEEFFYEDNKPSIKKILQFAETQKKLIQDFGKDKVDKIGLNFDKVEAPKEGGYKFKDDDILDLEYWRKEFAETKMIERHMDKEYFERIKEKDKLLNIYRYSNVISFDNSFENHMPFFAKSLDEQERQRVIKEMEVFFSQHRIDFREIIINLRSGAITDNPTLFMYLDEEYKINGTLPFIMGKLRILKNIFPKASHVYEDLLIVKLKRDTIKDKIELIDIGDDFYEWEDSQGQVSFRGNLKELRIAEVDKQIVGDGSYTKSTYKISKK